MDKITILGWGSLIWNPESLQIDKSQGENGWFKDGPLLPIEFARISQDGRLTLVIKNTPAKYSTIPVLYSFSTYKELDAAILNLAIREGCNKDKVEIYKKEDTTNTAISKWAKEKNIDAVIWTGLSQNFKDKIGQEFNEENVITYLRFLLNDTKTKAEEYIRRTPSQIKTPIRKIIEKKLGWTNIAE